MVVPKHVFDENRPREMAPPRSGGGANAAQIDYLERSARWAYEPGSVVDDHLSTTDVTVGL